MQLLPLRIRRIFSKKGKQKGSMLHLERDTVLFIGILLLSSALLGILAWDGYAFYQLIFFPEEEASMTSTSTVLFSAQDINAVLATLDDREKKFDTILRESGIISPSVDGSSIGSSTDKAMIPGAATSSADKKTATTSAEFPWPLETTSSITSAGKWMMRVLFGIETEVAQ